MDDQVVPNVDVAYAYMAGDQEVPIAGIPINPAVVTSVAGAAVSAAAVGYEYAKAQFTSLFESAAGAIPDAYVKKADVSTYTADDVIHEYGPLILEALPTGMSVAAKVALKWTGSRTKTVTKKKRKKRYRGRGGGLKYRWYYPRYY